MVAEYVSGIKAAWDVAKALKTATDSIDDAHIKLQMAELISALADAKIEAAENAEKIAALESRINAKSQFEFDGKKYFKILEDNEREGPYCPTCFDSQEKQIRLQYYPGSYTGDWHCQVCKGSFG